MWLLLGIGSGLSDALMNMFGKKALKDASPYLFLFAFSAFSLPVLLIAIPWLGLAPTNFTFWWSATAASLTNVIAMILWGKALKEGELSLTVPLLAFMPVFMIFTSRIMLHESAGPLGIFGIILVVAGTYILRLNRESGIFGPFRNLIKDKSAIYMLGVAVIGSINSNWDAMAVRNSNPLTYLLFLQAVSIVAAVPLIYFRTAEKFKAIKTRWNFLLLTGLFSGLALLAQMTVLGLTIVPYANSLKRTSALFSVILGFIAFKEKGVKAKLVGVVLIIAGVLLIAVSKE